MFIFTSECVLPFSFSGEYSYPVVKRTLPACPLSTSCVIHPYCYTDMLTRPSLPLLTWPSTVWLYLSAQRSVLSPLPMADNRHHRTQTSSQTDLSISPMLMSTKYKLVIQAYETQWEYNSVAPLWMFSSTVSVPSTSTGWYNFLWVLCSVIRNYRFFFLVMYLVINICHGFSRLCNLR